MKYKKLATRPGTKKNSTSDSLPLPKQTNFSIIEKVQWDLMFTLQMPENNEAYLKITLLKW